MSKKHVILLYLAAMLLPWLVLGCNQNELLKKRAVLGKHRGNLGALIFTPDGKRLIVGSGWRTWFRPKGDLAVWDTETLKRIHYKFIREDYSAFAITPDGKRLVAKERWHIDIWDLDSFTRIGELGKLGRVSKGSRELGAMALSPDGKTLAVVGLLGTDVRMFDLDTLKKTRVLKGCYSSVAFSPDGKTFVAGEGVEFTDDDVTLLGTGAIYLWDTDTWTRRKWRDPKESKGICSRFFDRPCPIFTGWQASPQQRASQSDVGCPPTGNPAHLTPRASLFSLRRFFTRQQDARNRIQHNKYLGRQDLPKIVNRKGRQRARGVFAGRKDPSHPRQRQNRDFVGRNHTDKETVGQRSGCDKVKSTIILAS